MCRNSQEEINVYCDWIEGRLFPCIGTLKDEEKKAINEFEERVSSFYSDDMDPESIYEEGQDWIISKCIQVSEINSYMVGVSIVGLYHIWEKQICNHLKKEILFDWNINKKRLPQKWGQIIDTFKEYSTDLEKMPFYANLNELRLVANVVKHGAGESFKSLADKNADVVSHDKFSDAPPVSLGDYALLRAEIYLLKEHFMKYKEAVLGFWDYNFWQEQGERRPHVARGNKT